LKERLPICSVKGEISNFKKHFSGHFYFSLKDEYSQINCVMWKGKNAALSFLPNDGQEVIIIGKITVYEKNGTYQVDVGEIIPVGIGELQLAYERLKKKLKEEGLFDPGHKKAIPKYPDRIGIVTSPTGAAIKDIITIARRRNNSVELILNPVKVQGVGAAEDIVRAIKEFNDFKDVDLLIVGRGGGSLEDLWAFNEEIVARAIYDSGLPVISAVGHEIDYSISDFTADLRAATPSAAAELAIPEKEELEKDILRFLKAIYDRLIEKVKNSRDKLEAIEKSYFFRKPVDMVHQFSQRVDDQSFLMIKNFSHFIKINQEMLASFENKLNALNPESILKRGYSISYKLPEMKVVKSSREIKISDEVRIKFRDGSAHAKINEVKN
ncbi:exodeoxyribonuclease VII large subunit, partial [candidate division KSB1 bacterium]